MKIASEYDGLRANIASEPASIDFLARKPQRRDPNAPPPPETMKRLHRLLRPLHEKSVGKRGLLRTLLFAGLALLCWGDLAAAQASQQPTNPEIAVGFPAKPWVLQFDVTGFNVKTNGVQTDGRAYLTAKNPSLHLVLSVFLEKASRQATDDGCKKNQKSRLAQNADYKREKVETREAAGMEIVEFTIPEFHGAPVQQRNLFACLPKEDVYVDIHLSKVLFKSQEEELFNSVLNSAHFVDKSTSASKLMDAAPSSDAGASFGDFQEGNRYFLQQNFTASISPYQKALDAEKQSHSLDKNLLRVLVDNLGMAYGISGDLNRAEETLNYGVSQDPTYPMFYYNLACVSAGRNDMNKTMEFLRKAFSYKANVIPSESMPDPQKDDSFKPFMVDQRFREFLKSL
jgi:tetratricopeptide (TPR) repeat protein